jgi:type VI protein secretion system component VasK
MNLPMNEGLDLYYKAIKERSKKEAWQMWLAFQPTTDDNKIKQFEEFYRELTTPISTKSKDEIIQETLNIRKAVEKGGGYNRDI